MDVFIDEDTLIDLVVDSRQLGEIQGMGNVDFDEMVDRDEIEKDIRARLEKTDGSNEECMEVLFE
jgi:hypothetical protein